MSGAQRQRRAHRGRGPYFIQHGYWLDTLPAPRRAERGLEAFAPIRRLPTVEAINEPGFWPWQDIYANALMMTGRLDEAEAFLTPHEELAAQRAHRSAAVRPRFVLRVARRARTQAP
ncbi:hypothetical protein AB0I77_39670 [Streptomyces sp. NPDC050619]|uniref:hypothetical protein n=1 Tax=Streptomyces sp. NPDC050619 TaxID=3157214 RepID=UPI0034319458